MGRTNEKLWKSVVSDMKSGNKGGKPGQWSARKAQLAGKVYKDRGGGYTGPKTKAQKSMTKWTKEEWGTKSGKPSGKTGERYLPKKARESLTPAEYAATTRAKQEGTKAGKQFVRQPKNIAAKTARFR